MVLSWKYMYDALYLYNKLKGRLLKSLIEYVQLDTIEKSAEMMHEKNEEHRVELQMNSIGYSERVKKSERQPHGEGIYR